MNERKFANLGELRKLAKNSRNPEVLQDIYEKYHFDEIICFNIASNCKTNSYTRAKLATHSNVQIRYCIAQHSAKIKDEKALAKLAMDIPTIRELVARTTESEPIKELLFRANPKNERIRKICLKRMHKMECIEKFILTASSDELFSYATSILENKHLTKRALLTFLIVSDRLDDEHIVLIRKHNMYEAKYFEDFIKKFQKAIFIG